MIPTELDWSRSTETHNLHHKSMHKKDGSEFFSIKIISPKGFSFEKALKHVAENWIYPVVNKPPAPGVDYWFIGYKQRSQLKPDGPHVGDWIEAHDVINTSPMAFVTEWRDKGVPTMVFFAHPITAEDFAVSDGEW